MPYLIDGNNLMFALAEAGRDVGREGLCKLLAPLARRGERVQVIFDGAPPPAGHSLQIEQTGVAVTYAGAREADEILLERIAADSAPRRLTVVSTDREIRAAGRKRRCRIIRSQEFARMLVRLDEAIESARNARPSEPAEKRTGLSDEQTRQWLKEFGFGGV